MSRNIFDIAKKPHLLAALDAEIQKNNDEIQKDLAKIAKDPAYGLEWSNDLFKNAARDRLLRQLRWHIENNEQVEWTIEQLKAEVAKSNLKYSRAVPRSTSPTSNLMEQNLLEAYLDFVHGDSFGSGRYWFNKAQREDEEYKAASQAEYKAEKAARDAQAAAEALRKEEERKAKSKLRYQERKLSIMAMRTQGE